MKRLLRHIGGIITEFESIKTIIISVLASVLGSGGLAGLLFMYFRYFLNNKLNENDERERRKKDFRTRRLNIDDELTSAYGRMFFWIYKYIKTGERNGELEDAFQSLKEIEGRKKGLDREVIVDNDLD